jgi:glycosyltransferase involved in cell wall biosynthesis
MPSPPHIGFVTTSFPRHRGDPAGSFVFGMTRAFSKQGYRVDVVAPEPPEPTDWRDGTDWLENVSVTPAPYMRPKRHQTLFYGGGVPDNLTSNPMTALLVPPALLGLLVTAAARSSHWDAVVSHWLLPSAIIAALVKNRRARHLAIAHSADVHLIEKLPLKNAIASTLLRSADHVGFISNALRRRFLGILNESFAKAAAKRSSVTPMGIDPDSLVTDCSRGALRKELGLTRFTVLFLGRLVPIKGTSLLIDAIEGQRGMELIVAGQGPERCRLEEKARARKVNARFVGEVAEVERAELFRACDALVLPSIELGSGRTEGLPLVLVEALAARLPVIASDTGAVSEVIRNEETGLLVPPGDARALKGALSRIAADNPLRAGLIKRGAEVAKIRDWRALMPMFEEHLFRA